MGMSDFISSMQPEMAARLRTLKGSSGDGGGVMLTVCAIVGSMMLRLIRVNADRDTLRMKWKSDRLGVPELMDVLNKGVGGAGTTNRISANEYKGSADMAEFPGKFKVDQRIFAVVAGDAYAQFYLNALQMFCKPEMRLRKTHRVVVDADYDVATRKLLFRSASLHELSTHLQQLYTSLSREMRALLEAENSYPVLQTSRVQYPQHELFPICTV
jgi:hypothetical protein